MDVFEITGFQTGINRSGVNYLQPSDSFEEIRNGFIHRQVLQSRPGFTQFGNSPLGTRVMGIFRFLRQDSTEDTLACDLNYLYKYNGATNQWDQIPTAGTIGGSHAFNISSHEHYVSGTPYPDKDGADRFIFCSRGMSRIYVYDGTDVRDFTDGADYSPPIEGAITNAWHVMNFGERLNFFHCDIAGVTFPQSIFFSGIRDSSGNGDKFDVAGAGYIQPDTYELIQGISRVTDSIVIHMTNSNWRMDKTTDAFNPYILSKIPSTIGTNAPFSPVSWANESASLGKNGIISTDLRVTNRIDNAIPYFASSEISALNFALSYGGFDTSNGLFFWNFSASSDDDDDSGTDTATQEQILVRSYEESSWSFWDVRSSVFGSSSAGQYIPWDDINDTAHPEYPHWAEWDTTTEIWDNIGRSEEVEKTLFGDDNGFVWGLDQDSDDYSNTITAITKASTAQVTIGAHSFIPGDFVWIDNVEGMTEINITSIPGSLTIPNLYRVLSKDATSITINVDTTDYGTYTQGGLVSKPISFYAKTIPLNPYRDQGRKIYVSHIDFLIDSTGSNLVVDIIADEEQHILKTSAVYATFASTKPRQWISIIVNSEMEFLQLVLRQLSPLVKLRLTSIRIYAEPGGLTNA